MKNTLEFCRNEKGMVLPTALVFLAIIALLGSTAVLMTTTDLKIATNHKSAIKAFYDAEAGISYGVAKMGEGFSLDEDQFVLPTTIDTSVDLNFTTPTGFFFSLSPITMKGDNSYIFTSTGRSHGNSKAVIEVMVRRAQSSAIEYAVFGDSWVDIKNNGMIRSYDSSSDDITKNDPTSPYYISTGEADVGSNEYLSSQEGAYIDGNGVLGQDEYENDATNAILDESSYQGDEGVITLGERIDQDPLGVSSGGANDPFNFIVNNDNALSGVGNFIDHADVTTPITLIGKPGGANYYFTDFRIDNGAAVNIDSTNGPVNIYVDGGNITVSNSATLNATGEATDLSIFSNTIGDIKFKYSGIVKSLVYAPFADVFLMNSGDFYGSIWSNKTDLKNSGDIYFDVSLKDKYMKWLDKMEIFAWKDGAMN